MNTSLIEYKERFITKLKKFFLGIFKKNKTIQEQPKDQLAVKVQNNKSNLRDNIVIKRDEQDEKTFKLQESFKNGEIFENDIPKENKEKLIELYKRQNEEMKEKIKREKLEIEKMLKDLKAS